MQQSFFTHFWHKRKPILKLPEVRTENTIPWPDMTTTEAITLLEILTFGIIEEIRLGNQGRTVAHLSQGIYRSAAIDGNCRKRDLCQWPMRQEM